MIFALDLEVSKKLQSVQVNHLFYFATCSIPPSRKLMGSSLPCASSTSEDDVTVLSSCDSDNNDVLTEDEYFDRDKPLEDLYFLSENDDSEVCELDAASDDILHVCDSHEFLCGKSAITNHKGNKVVNGIEVMPLIMDVFPEFVEDEALQCIEEIQSVPYSFDNGEGLSSTLVHIDTSFKTTNLQLVSCMKGSRAQQGMPVNVLLRVKWAPDVYDPPVTSGSHTVKGHHRRPKPMKKDHHKQKHIKSKTSHGSSSSDKRHASHRSSSGSDKKHGSYRSSSRIDPRIARLKALNGGAVVVNPPARELNMDDDDDDSDYAIRTLDLKCGSSLFVDSLTTPALPCCRGLLS